MEKKKERYFLLYTLFLSVKGHVSYPSIKQWPHVTKKQNMRIVKFLFRKNTTFMNA